MSRTKTTQTLANESQASNTECERVQKGSGAQTVKPCKNFFKCIKSSKPARVVDGLLDYKGRGYGLHR